MILVSPTEPEDIIALLGNQIEVAVNSQAEIFGADYLFEGFPGKIGVQRKTEADFIASATGGRLANETRNLSACGVAILLLESRERWNPNGTHPFHNGWQRDNVRNLRGLTIDRDLNAARNILARGLASLAQA